MTEKIIKIVYFHLYLSMNTLLLVLLIFGLSMLAMNLGLILKNKPLKKACGDSPDGCEICGGEPEKCESNF